MSDDINIKLKTTLEADEAKSAQQIESQLPSITGKIKGKVKVVVEADAGDAAKTIQQSVNAATTSQKTRKLAVPVDIDLRISNKQDYLRRKLEQDFKTFQSQSKALKIDTSAFESAFSSNALRDAREELTILFKTLRAISAADISKLPDLSITNFSENVRKATSDMDTLQARVNALSFGDKAGITKQITDARIELQELSKIEPGGATDEHIAKFNAIKLSIGEITSALTTLRAEDRNFKLGIGAEKLQTDIERVKQNLLNMKTNWSAMFKDPELTASWDRLWERTTSGAITSRVEVTALGKSVSLLGKQVEGAGLKSKTFFGQLKDNVKKFSQWFFIGGGVSAAVRGLRDIITAVKDVNVQMTELRKVTDETEASYNRFLSRAKSRSVDLGASLSDYIGSVADFSRMGYSIADSETLSDVTTVYYKVGDGMKSMEDATQSVISTLKAYNLTADQAARVTDVMNEVSNRFAVTSAGIGAGMQRAGAALSTANTSFEKSVALWTAMNEVVQNDESSATSLRFIAQRMRNTAGQLEEMGEDAEGAAESVTKLQQQIRGLTGVNIMDDADTFRDVYDVLKDVSDIWDDITDKDRADVIRLMAGTRQSAAFSALMQNFSSAEKALEVALNSTGSAAAEHDKWLKSIEASQAKAKASFESFATSIMSSDLIKFVYDAQSGILGFLNNITNKLETIPTLVAAAAAALSFKNKGKTMPTNTQLLYGVLAQ